MTVSLTFLVARFLLVVPFVLIGADRLRTPGGRRVWAALGLVGAASVTVGLWGDLGALLLALVALGWALSDPRFSEERLLLAVGLAGGAIAVFAVYAAVGEAIDLTATDPAVVLDLR